MISSVNNMNLGKQYFNTGRNIENKNIDFSSLLESDAIKASSNNQRDYYVKSSTDSESYKPSSTYTRKGQETIEDNQGNDDGSESDTKTDIIVKPDGSRVLVITTNIGGMESTMSLELSGPTNMLNEAKMDDEKKNDNINENKAVVEESKEEDTEFSTDGEIALTITE